MKILPLSIVFACSLSMLGGLDVYRFHTKFDSESHAETVGGVAYAQSPKEHRQALALLLNYLSEQYSGIQALEQDTLIAQEGVSSAKSSFDPTLSLQLSASEKLSAVDQTVNGATVKQEFADHDGNAQLIFRKRLYDWGKTANNVSAAQQRLRLSELSVVQQRESTYFLALQAYYATLRSIARRRIREQNLQSLQSRFEEAEQRLKAGVGTALDLVTAEASLAQGRSNLSLEIASYQATLNNLKIYAPEGFAQLLPQQVELPAPPEHITNLSLERTLELQQLHSTTMAVARQQVHVAEADVVSAQDVNNPELGVQLDLTHQRGFGHTRSGNSFATASLNFSMPVIASSATDSSIAVAQKTLTRQHLKYRSLHDQQASLAQKVWYEMKAFSESVLAAKSNLHSQQELLSRAEQSRQVGQTSLTSLLDQQDKVRDARILLIDTQHQHLIKAYELVNLLGLPLGENL